MPGGLADLLGELALARSRAGLPLLVELAGRHLEQVGLADRLARLADEPDVLAVVGDDRRRRRGGATHSRVDLLAVLVAERALADVDDRALEDACAPEALERSSWGGA